MSARNNADREPLPFRQRHVLNNSGLTSDSLDSQQMSSPDSVDHADSSKKSIVPLVSDDGSRAGSAATNRAHHSASASLSNQMPASAGVMGDSYLSDGLSERGAEAGVVQGRSQMSQHHRRSSGTALTHSMSRLAAENRTGRGSPGASETRLPRFSAESADELAGSDGGRSRLAPRRMRTSPISNDDPGSPSTRPAEMASPPRGSRDSMGGLNDGQESARGLSNDQKSAGGLSAVAGDEQLINEVRGIYAGLVMVEKKCIEIDKQQSESKNQLSAQQWQALISLHRTLLQEHHDFFMASQHPSASPVLKRLSEKYAMPARMWRYGIHAFLELLRHRLPDSLEHMLTFIYLAYSMMTLLIETVPAFEETWIECLGDLSRYRMAVEEVDLRDREVWAGVGRYWYNQAADRNPDIGRIQHHLAVLARPDITQQLFFYTKSLVSVRSFAGTRESILLLFNPLLKGPRPHQTPVIAAFVAAHGNLFIRSTAERFIMSADDFLAHLDKHIGRIGTNFKMQGVYMTSSNLATMLEYGAADAVLPGEFFRAAQEPRSIEDVYQSASERWPSVNDPQKAAAEFLALKSSSSLPFHGSWLTFETLSIFLDQLGDKNIFPAFHVSLAFLWCLALTVDGMKFAEAVVPWQKIVTFLNTMVQRPWVDIALVEKAEFPISDETQWVPEDFLIRGQIWSQCYYPSGFFEGSPDEEDGRFVERPSRAISRTFRCLWLGVRLATFQRWFTYDTTTRQFSATPFATELERLSQPHNPLTGARPPKEET